MEQNYFVLLSLHVPSSGVCHLLVLDVTPKVICSNLKFFFPSCRDCSLFDFRWPWQAILGVT